MDESNIASFLINYWWVPPVILGMTEWVKSLCPDISPRLRDSLLPLTALVISLMAVYAPRLLPPTELDDLVGVAILWLTTTGIVKFTNRMASKGLTNTLDSASVPTYSENIDTGV
jgi:hypothetical protein